MEVFFGGYPVKDPQTWIFLDSATTVTFLSPGPAGCASSRSRSQPNPLPLVPCLPFLVKAQKCPMMLTDGILSSISKLCSLLVMVQGNPEVESLPQNHFITRQCQIMVPGNDHLFYGYPSYSNELASLSNLAIQHLVSSAALGSLALEACNCIASSFRPSSETSLICSKLIETAKPCLSKRDRFLQSTVKFLDEQFSSSSVAPQIAVVINK